MLLEPASFASRRLRDWDDACRRPKTQPYCTASAPARGRAEPPPARSGIVAVDSGGVFVIKGLKVAGRAEVTVKISRSK
jgi:hypothetical protein